MFSNKYVYQFLQHIVNNTKKQVRTPSKFLWKKIAQNYSRFNNTHVIFINKQ